MLTEAALSKSIQIQVSFTKDFFDSSYIYADEDRLSFVLLQCLQYAIQQTNNSVLILNFSLVSRLDEPCFG